MDALFQPVANLKGIGAKRAEALAKLGIQTPYDLLYHVPRSYLTTAIRFLLRRHP